MEITYMIIFVTIIFFTYLYFNNIRNNLLVESRAENMNLKSDLKEFQKNIIDLEDELGKEREKNKTIISQKKSSEVRIGQISEHLVPFLANCPHNPKDMHFLGMPVDFVSFDLDEGKITFIEVKSGSSKTSKRQKTIKNIVKSGRVFYDEIRINEKGIKHKQYENLEPSKELDDDGEN